MGPSHAVCAQSGEAHEHSYWQSSSKKSQPQPAVLHAPDKDVQMLQKLFSASQGTSQACRAHMKVSCTPHGDDTHWLFT